MHGSSTSYREQEPVLCCSEGLVLAASAPALSRFALKRVGVDVVLPGLVKEHAQGLELVGVEPGWS